MLKCVNLFWEVLHSWVNHWILKTLGGSESHFVLLALLPCFKNLSSCPKFAFRIFHGSIIFWWILFNNENENFVRPTSQVLIFYEMLHLSGKTNYFIQKFLASSNKRNKTDTNYQSWNVSRRYIGLNSKTHSLKDLLNITCSTVYISKLSLIFRITISNCHIFLRGGGNPNSRVIQVGEIKCISFCNRIFPSLCPLPYQGNIWAWSKVVKKMWNPFNRE